MSKHAEEETACTNTTSKKLRKQLEDTQRAAFYRTLRFMFLEGTTGIVIRLLWWVPSAFAFARNAKRSIIGSSRLITEEAYSLGGRLSAAQRSLLDV